MKHVFNCSGHELKIPDIVDSNGVYLYDEGGNTYMDLESGVWCTSLGHKNHRVNQVIKNQIESIMHVGFCYAHKIVDQAAAAVLSVTGHDNGKCVFLSSGSEAIEILRQMCKQLNGRQNTLALHDAYLGSYGSVTDRNTGWYSLNWDKCKSCPKQSECDSNCELLVEIPEDITEFIFEPVVPPALCGFHPKP